MSSAPTARHTPDLSDDSFGRRLKAERERRRIALEAIAANTKIGIGLLRGLERDDVSRWPSGVFRRSFIRSYAEAIGLDPEDTLREFLERFPDPLERELAIAGDGRSESARRVAAQPVLRLTLADSPEVFSGGQILVKVGRRLAAAAWDAGTILALALTAYIIIDKFWQPLGVAMLCYYLGGILFLGNTPGVCLFAPRGHDGGDSFDHHPGDETSASDHDAGLSDLGSAAALERVY
jgi:transcriptional regulator with XRE-family HTH domain